MKKKDIIKAGITLMMLVWFSACKEKSAEVKKDMLITGSESEKSLVQYLANHFVQTNRSVNIVVNGGGSEYGISELKSGKCDIANSSRVFGDSDYAGFKSDSVKQAIIAVDAIAIITHPSLNISKLSLQQVADIYSGKIKNWKELGGPDCTITPVGRKEGSGTRIYMKHRFNIEEFALETKEYKKYEEIVDHVSKDRNAVGYVSLKYALDVSGTPNSSIYVIPVSIDGSPAHLPYNHEAISYGEYPLIRPLFQYYIPGRNENIEKFIEFELSLEGQQLLQKIGYYPINDFHKQINMMKM